MIVKFNDYIIILLYYDHSPTKTLDSLVQTGKSAEQKSQATMTPDPKSLVRGRHFRRSTLILEVIC